MAAFGRPKAARALAGRRECTDCGGALLPGSVAFPLLGAPKFGYKLRTMEVSVALAACMCESCGLVEFRAGDPRPVQEARAALLRAGEAEPS